jgi:hypothetical protein
MVAPFMINNVQDVTVNLLKHTYSNNTAEPG